MAHLNMLDAARRTGAMAEKKKKWMKLAVPENHKGRFTAKAERAGKSVAEFSKEKEHAPGTLGKEARLAERFEEAAKRGSRAHKRATLYNHKKD